MPSMGYEQLARDITVAAIEHGACNEGDPAQTVGDYYGSVCAALQQIDMELGNDAMSATAVFTTSAINAGMIYAGDETIGFMKKIAERVRATNREVGVTGNRY